MTISRRRVLGSLVGFIVTAIEPAAAQDFLPSPPGDKAAVYVLDDQNKLAPMPFEQGQTSLHPDQVAKSTKTGFIELKGEHAITTASSDVPRIFLFTVERQGTHAPFLVWLTPHRGARRVTAIAQKGMPGFAIDSEQIIKPLIRVLAKDGDQVFIEIRPRSSLIPGEYAIIGDDLTRIATFRVVTARR